MGRQKTGSRDGWTRVRFGDVVENVNDQPKRSMLPLDTRYVAGEHVDENRVTIDRWGTLGDDTVPPTFKRRFQPGDVLFHSRNLKKIAVPDFGGITGEKLFVLRSTSPDLLQAFLPYVLLMPAFTRYAEASWSGSVNKFLNWTPLAKYEFDLPPVEQQQQRLRVLTRSTELMESLLHAERLASAVTQSAVDNLVVLWTGCTRLLSDVATVWDCKHHTPKMVDGGVPMTSPGVTRWGPLALDACKLVDPTQADAFMDHVQPKPYDLVMGRNQVVGIASYVSPGNTRFVLGQDTVLIRGTELSGMYLCAAIRSTFVQNQMRSLSLGTTFNRINLRDIRGLRIPSPPHDVSDQIGGEYLVIERTEREMTSRNQKAQEVHRSLIGFES